MRAESDRAFQSGGHISTMVHPDVVVYPDTGKIGVFVGSAPGGAPEESELKRFLDGSAEIDYWRDEE